MGTGCECSHMFQDNHRLYLVNLLAVIGDVSDKNTSLKKANIWLIFLLGFRLALAGFNDFNNPIPKTVHIYLMMHLSDCVSIDSSGPGGMRNLLIESFTPMKPQKVWKFHCVCQPSDAVYWSVGKYGFYQLEALMFQGK